MVIRATNVDRTMAVCPPIDLVACAAGCGVAGRPFTTASSFACCLRSSNSGGKRCPTHCRSTSRKPTSLWEFDDCVTAPLCGFFSAQAYYEATSPARRLAEIRVPTLILAASDDPLVAAESFASCPKSPQVKRTLPRAAATSVSSPRRVRARPPLARLARCRLGDARVVASVGPGRTVSELLSITAARHRRRRYEDLRPNFGIRRHGLAASFWSPPLMIRKSGVLQVSEARWADCPQTHTAGRPSCRPNHAVTSITWRGGQAIGGSRRRQQSSPPYRRARSAKLFSGRPRVGSENEWESRWRVEQDIPREEVQKKWDRIRLQSKSPRFPEHRN